ncbi:MAG: alcohol dehydrogenase catalytic domain-containing protein, partial [Actinobacteria bacterium]|nr:alcohol dehydrogenase catalytic domain-containing protein [Actinomycetota bacterium]
LELSDEPEPRPGADEVILEVDAVGVFGSDVHGFAGITDRRKPGVVMGHEIGGRIVSGPGAGPQTVTVFPQLGCGTCASCRAGLEQLCESLRIIGVDPQRLGGFAERIPVPAANVVPMPDVSPVVAALVEPYAVALNAVGRTDVAGARVLVVGCGAIGQLVALAAARAGAATVSAFDVATDRLALAARLGATVPDAGEDLLPWIATHGGDVDVVFDAVGTDGSLAEALACTRPGGTVVEIGLGAADVTVNLQQLVGRQCSLLGSYAYPRSIFLRAARELGEGVPGVESLVTAVVPLTAAASRLAALAHGQDRSLRVQLSPSGRCLTATA